jgi:uncharacterized membrane protein
LDKYEEFKKQATIQVERVREIYDGGAIKFFKSVVPQAKVQKLYDLSKIEQWSEWSTFEWLCLLYEVKKGLIIIIKVIEVFLNTDDPKEAEE